MVNQELVDLLKQGVAVWNAWQKEHPEVPLDFRRAELGGTTLSYTKLINANLSKAKLYFTEFTSSSLIGAKLTGATLRNVTLIGATLRDADLSEADPRGADLNYANLSGTNLSKTDLRDADLICANLSYAKLRCAYFQATHLASTTFARVDLRSVKGLSKAIHDGPSIVDVKTVRFPEGDTRTYFLRGAGFSDAFIDYLPSLSSTAIQYASCFISYASQNKALAQQLYHDLQDKDVRCWFAPHDMRVGDKIRMRIDEAIHVYEKLLLLLSKRFLASNWVEDEVEIAFAKERKQNHEVFFPIHLDETIMQASQAWAKKLRNTRHIGDFTGWTDPQAYQRAYERLLGDLKKESNMERWLS